MSPDKRFAARIIEVALHEKVEKMGGITADGAQFGVAALEDLVAEGSTHVGAAFKKRAGKLQRGENTGHRTAHDRRASRSAVPQPLPCK